MDEDDRVAAMAGLVTAKCGGGGAAAREGSAAAAAMAAAEADLAAAESHSEALYASLVAAAGGAPDAEILEDTLPPSVAARAAEMEKKLGRKRGEGRGGDGDDGQRKKRTRKKKIILPKGFDPEKPGPAPDPDRWLPLRERSSYRGKRKKVNIRGAQGAANMSSDLKSKEFSGGAGGATAVEDAKGKAAVPEGMEKLLMAGGNKKGKKKGKR